jgi:hypothetical protein
MVLKQQAGPYIQYDNRCQEFLKHNDVGPASDPEQQFSVAIDMEPVTRFES